MIPGFEKIVEQRILTAQKNGIFDNLEGEGKALNLPDDSGIPPELCLACKIMKNAGYVPPEIELKKQIRHLEDIIADMGETSEKYHSLKKLNFLIMQLNSMRKTSAELEIPQHYSLKIIQRMEKIQNTQTRSKINPYDF
jgi:hypothetical protein